MKQIFVLFFFFTVCNFLSASECSKQINVSLDTKSITAFDGGQSVTWKIRYGTIYDDGCAGVYEHQVWIYNAASGQYEWFTYKADCLCEDCRCNC